jgi:ABC-type Fe3+/spermidine/putrescine transport system ATPase subunit
MTVAGNVAFPLEVRRVPRTEIRALVAEVLRLVHLDGLADRRPSQLSGGQQQRVALARALVFKPGILLLDEPLAALDRKLRDEVRLELRRIQRTLGVTTLLVTHDQDEALSLSDRLLVLDRGEVQQIGTPDELYLRPANRFVADFLGTANLLPGGRHLPGEAGGAVNGHASLALVRPERIVLQPASAPDGLPAAVTESVYHGQTVRYHLRLDDGSELVAVAADRVPRFSAGARVKANWNPDDVWIIPAEKSGHEE